MSTLTLYSYWRSSAAYRVRIALNLKGLDYQMQTVDLSQGEQQRVDYRSCNPQGLVPSLTAGTRTLTQSLAIIEYLEERYPQPALLPAQADERARVRALAHIVACDIHPLNNLRVLTYLQTELGISESARTTWYQHWILQGCSALNALLQPGAAARTYCCGEQPGLADCCLVPQIYNAKRFGCDLTPFPAVTDIYEQCMQLAAFQRAAPEAQPDAPSG